MQTEGIVLLSLSSQAQRTLTPHLVNRALTERFPKRYPSNFNLISFVLAEKAVSVFFIVVAVSLVVVFLRNENK